VVRFRRRCAEALTSGPRAFDGARGAMNQA
jgi:hypothetical protein